MKTKSKHKFRDNEILILRYPKVDVDYPNIVKIVSVTANGYMVMCLDKNHGLVNAVGGFTGFPRYAIDIRYKRASSLAKRLYA